MEVQQIYRQIVLRLKTITDEREAKQIARWLLAHHYPNIIPVLLSQSKEVVRADKQTIIEAQLNRLLKHEPIQYVIEETWFDELRLSVTPAVLIPRPETEELVHWVAEKTINPQRILDVGTGSGCLAIALKKRYPSAAVSGWDVSAAALEVANDNASRLDYAISFLQVNLLQPAQWPVIAPQDLIVSNPPYIPEGERISMASRVKDFEPAIALFVPDNDPLLFYDALLHLAKKTLAKDGWLMVEIHHEYAAAIHDRWQAQGAGVIEVKNDWQGKARMVALQLR